MASKKEADLVVIETTGNTRKLEIKWLFRNATSEWSNKENGEKMRSPLSHAKGDEEVKWCITIYPNGNTKIKEGYISAFLWLKDSPADRSTIAATYSFSIYDEEKEKFLVPEIHSRIPQSFTSKQDWGWSKLAQNSVVLGSKIFSVICKLEYEDSRTTTTSVLCGPSTQLNNEEANSSLDQNFEQLFTNRSDTDVCFVIDGKEIKAHKLILSARSPVFAAMLKSGMKESVSNRVEIDDIAPDIFEALLRFIYTDRVDLTRIETKDLLAAANKYLLPLLKFECQQFLARRITAENCVELLALADLHNAVHLKKSTATFVRLHRADIFQTEEWKNLRQSRPYLALDTIEGLI